MTQVCTKAVAVAGLAALVSGVHCTTDCSLAACLGGFEWIATPEGGQPIPPGDYVLELVVEDTPHEIACAISDTRECTAAIDGAFVIIVTTDADTPAGPSTSLSVAIADYSADGGDRSESVRGPEQVAIVLRLGDRVLVDASYEPEYERDETFWGDERCGYCDLRVTEASTWAP